MFIIYLFRRCCVSVAAQAFPSLWRAGATLQLWCSGFSLQWLLLLGSSGSRAQAQQLWVPGCRAQAQQLWVPGCRAQAQQLWVPGSRAQAQQLWCTSLVDPWHVGSSGTRDQTCVSCIHKVVSLPLSHQRSPRAHFL